MGRNCTAAPLFTDRFDCEVENKLNEAMPWVGVYIIAASGVCTLAMAVDACNGFRRKKLWFPCKFFSLNATSLTFLTVAMKLPVDLTTNMLGSPTDIFAKYISLIFMSTALANFMPSLGSMNNKEILANVVALGILVITIAANVLIQLFLLSQLESYFGPEIFIFIVPVILMLLLLFTLMSLAVTIPTTKSSLESKYQEQHKLALRKEEILKRRDAFAVDNHRGEMIKYLVMAETSSPQFVMARSVVCTTSAMICWLAALIVVLVHFVLYDTEDEGKSPYGGYTKGIFYVQSIGVVVGIIAPTLRWFIAASFKCSTTNLLKSIKKAFKIEDHWIRNLVDWRDSFSALQTRENKFRKYLHDGKWSTITFCIVLQIFIVFVSKLLAFLSALLMKPFYLCFTCIKKFMMQHLSKYKVSNYQQGHESGDDTYLNLSRYVLLLEGEAELPTRFLKNICREADNLIQTGGRKSPQSLVNLLGEFFVNFSGVGQFDSNQVPSLHSQEPPNCWTLPVVTLTCIATALPNIGEHKRKQLLSSVSEGLTLAKLVEKTLDKNAQLVNIKKAADISWLRVVLYKKWRKIDLKRTSLESKNSKAVLEELSEEAKRIVDEYFKEKVQNPFMKSPLNWPAKVVAANSMYRISQSILLSRDEENKQTDEVLFERLSVMIADILAACLTNLPRVILTLCRHSAIEKREKSVREAFLLLGKTEKVVELLQKKEWPSLGHDEAADIEEWRAWFRQDHPMASASISTDERASLLLNAQ